MLIGADIGMRQLEETGRVDVLGIASFLRQDRGGMIQTQKQYLFLHKVRTKVTFSNIFGQKSTSV